MLSLFRKIQVADFAFPPHFSADIKAFISTILVPDPAARITVSEIIAHP